LVDPRIIPELEGTEYYAGPKNAFSAVYFTASLALPLKGGGLEIRTKDHDFTVGRSVYVQASFDKSFPAEDTLTRDTYLAFLAAECKTNLDKTMFQEAAATAHDLKTAVVGARYYVLCEWLDMTPISTATTDIDEVIILRGKRLPSARREKHATAAVGRQKGIGTFNSLRIILSNLREFFGSWGTCVRFSAWCNQMRQMYLLGGISRRFLAEWCWIKQ
jgi:hypothetical protein